LTKKSCSPTECFPTNSTFTIEIYLNKPIQIGCFQLKLKFNKELTSPFELTLYKQKKQFETKSIRQNIDSQIDFFNTTDKYELLYGPVDISEFLDLTCSKTYSITIASDKLLETRSNLFFISIKPATTTVEPTRQRANTIVNISSILNKVNITIRKYCRTNLANETAERGLMLLRTDFFASLLEFINETVSSECLLNVLDILNWIVFNHFSIDSKHLQALVEIFNSHLTKFMLVFYLCGNRSTSRKATLLLNFFLNKNVDRRRRFERILLDNLIELLEMLPYFESSAAMNWYFILLHRVMGIQPKETYDKCMAMLVAFSKGKTFLLISRFNTFSNLKN